MTINRDGAIVKDIYFVHFCLVKWNNSCEKSVNPFFENNIDATRLTSQREKCFQPMDAIEKIDAQHSPRMHSLFAILTFQSIEFIEKTHRKQTIGFFE